MAEGGGGSGVAALTHKECAVDVPVQLKTVRPLDVNQPPSEMLTTIDVASLPKGKRCMEFVF